jgi:hypothetical protein
MRVLAILAALSLPAGWVLMGQQARGNPDPRPDPRIQSAPNPALAPHKLTYGVEWRLVRAGMVTVEARPVSVHTKIESAGLVSKLFKIEDTYAVQFEDAFCATASTMESMEGKRHRRTLVTYDRVRNHASYSEHDLVADRPVRSGDVATSHCVHDVMGALLTLRGFSAEPGQAIELPVSDGARFAQVKIEAQEREDVKTAAGSFKTVRYEAHLMNGVVYSRKGRVFIWVTDDTRRLPVQIRVRANFPVGTVTLGLEKEEAL